MYYSHAAQTSLRDTCYAYHSTLLYNMEVYQINSNEDIEKLSLDFSSEKYIAEKYFGIADITGAYLAGIILCNIHFFINLQIINSAHCIFWEMCC